MKRLRALVSLCCCVLASCQGGGGTDAPVVPVSVAGARPFPSDAEILSKAYNPLFQAPENFLIDERANMSQSISLHHVKNDSGDYELCTDDFAQALAWETADNENAAVQGAFTGSLETDRYFEFIRELTSSTDIGNIAGSTLPGFARVFKCTYVNRNGVNRHARNGDAGTLNAVEISQANIQYFTEYMWQFTFFWPATKTVLETFSTETAAAYQHTLLLAFLTNRGTDSCDLVEVVDWTFSVDKISGHMTKEFMPIYDLESRLDDSGTPVVCAN